MSSNYWAEVVEMLNEASDHYYNGEPSDMTDKQWDDFYNRLLKKEKEQGFPFPNSPTQKAGAAASGEKQTLKYPALSLDKTKDVSLLAGTLAKGMEDPRCELPGAVLMWKMDGSTVQLDYENGKLVSASTRGNGLVGTNILRNVKYVKGVPQKITETGPVTVRGECVMSFTEFNRLVNDQAPEEEPYTSPRNLANSTIIAQDEELPKNRQLTFFAFNLVHHPDYDNTHDHVPWRFQNRLRWMQEQKFNVVPYQVSWPFKEEQKTRIEQMIGKWSDQVAEFDYPVDGLVLALDDAEFANLPEFSGTDKHPHVYRGYALKWQDETAETVLREIEWSGSKTGRLNGVAIFDPVKLENSTVTRATLCNVSWQLERKLKPGDRISVYLANKIIPCIDENLSDPDREPWTGNITEEVIKKYSLPSMCPYCGGRVEFVRTLKNVTAAPTVTAMCVNPACRMKKIGLFDYFCSPNGLNIKSMGDARITDFVRDGILTEYSDFFHLDRYKELICSMDGLGEKSYDGFIKSVDKARNTDFISFLASLSIPNIGHGQLKLIQKWLVEKYQDKYRDGTLQSVMDGFLWYFREVGFNSDFSEIEGIGPVRSASLSAWADKELVPWLLYAQDTEFGRLFSEVTIHDDLTKLLKPAASAEDKINGKTFVVTGDVYHYKNRKELQKEIENRGGKVAGSVSKKTDYLINNDVTSTSSKNQKAKELGIPIISEEDFMKML